MNSDFSSREFSLPAAERHAHDADETGGVGRNSGGLLCGVVKARPALADGNDELFGRVVWFDAAA